MIAPASLTEWRILHRASARYDLPPRDWKVTVVLDVRSLSDTLADAALVMAEDRAEGTARISFDSPELLWAVLTAKRWELLRALCGAGPVSIREAARRVERDVKAVHRDTMALLQAGLLQRAANGGIEFPFDAVKVEFLLRAA